MAQFDCFFVPAAPGRKMEADSSEEAIKIQKQTAQTGTTVGAGE